MELSDEDRAAILRLRRQLDEMSPAARKDLEWLLLQVAAVAPEPADGTFWFDPEESDVWLRDDRAVDTEEDNYLNRWWCTGATKNFSWGDVAVRAPRLVELVRKDTMAGKARTILYELASTWQAWHHNACGRGVKLARCTYHECTSRHQALLGYGIEANWEES